MSWIKKILNIFTVEVEENTDIDRENNNNNHQNINRNIETKIKYEYPKGAFRFPMIPDDERKSRQQRERTPKPVVQHKKKEYPVNKQREEMVSKPMVKRKVEPKNKQPFRPTEIPSPVYGFKRPQRQRTEEIFEFELSNEENIDSRKSQTITNEWVRNNEVENINAEKKQLLNMEDSFHLDTKIDQDEIHINQQVNEGFDTIFSPNEMNESKDLPNEESVEQVDFFTNENNSISEQDVFEPLPKLDVMNEQSDENSLHSINHSTFVDDLKNNDLSDEIVSEESFENEDLMTDEEDYTDFQESEDMFDENNEFAPTKMNEQTETENTTRSHLPFNVMMLKQDKQKLEQNRQLNVADNETQTTFSNEIDEFENVKQPFFVFPHSNLLIPPVMESADNEWILEQSSVLNETLMNFNVRASVVNVSQGPSVTRFEIQPEPGVKVNKITNLSDDLKLSLAAKDIRIEAPIPGKHTIGIEIPNMKSRPVMISEIILNPVFKESKSPLTAALGLDISGNPIITDLRKMPHGLIAGATGSGKSVCINSILVSLLYKATPSELKLLLIDPKMVELAPYNHIPHLVSPVITDVKAATAALKWAVEEMERRYELFAHTGVRDIQRFNELAEKNRQFNEKLPYIVIIIDELADLMMMSPADVEEAICRIAQKARACGIHLIIATQRPSVDVITGLIKANVPTRIAFSVSSQVDSRTIIDISGAEKLLGRGDMLFLENGSSKPVRLQGTFVSDEEIDRVVHHVRQEEKPNYLFEQEELLKKAQIEEEEDEIFLEACEFVIDQGGASTSLLQRNFRIGYNRAARLIEMMEQQGIISEAKGSKPRDILISKSDLEVLYEMH